MRARCRGWAHAASAVWELRREDGVRAFLKLHRQPRKFKQELHAYRVWAPQLSEVVPHLLASDEKQGALLLSAAPGALAVRASLTRAQEEDVHRQVGAFLARLHALPFEDTDPVPLAEAVKRRSAAWAARAEGHVEGATLRWVSARTAEATDLLRAGSFSRVPTHGDFSPRNWLVDQRGGVYGPL